MLIAFSVCNGNAINLDSIYQRTQIDSLIEVSNAEYDKGNLLGCINARTNAVVLLKKLKDWRNVAQEYNILYVANKQYDDLTNSNNSIDSAWHISKKYLDSTDLIYIATVSNLGYVEYINKNYNTCIPYFEHALDLYKRIDASLEDIYITAYCLVLSYRQKGRYKASTKLAESIYAVLDTNDMANVTEKTELSLLLGINASRNLKSNEAFKHLRKAIYFNNIQENYKQKCINEVNIALALSRLFKFKSEFESAFQILENLDRDVIDKSMLEERIWNLKGQISLEVRNYSKAKSSFMHAYNILEKLKVRSDKELSNYCSGIGESYIGLNQLDSASYYLNESLLLSKMNNIETFNSVKEYKKVNNFNINNIKTLARVAELNRQYFIKEKNSKALNKSIFYYRQANKGARYLQKELTSKHSKYILNKNLQEHYPAYLSLLLEIYSEEKSPEIFQEILQLIEDNKAVILKEDVQDKLAIASSSIPDELLAKEDEFKEQLNTLKRRIHDFRPKNEEDQAIINKWKEEQLQTTRAYNDHQKYLEDNYPDYFKAKYEIQTISLEELKKELEKDQVFLSFYESEENYYCAWIKKNTEGIHIVEKTDALQNDLNKVLEVLRTNPLNEFEASDFENFSNSSHRLYETLLPKEIRNNSSIIISQIGELYFLPFEVLLTDQYSNSQNFADLPYLLKSQDIQYASSAELWLASKKAISKNQNLAAVSFAPFTEGEITDERSCEQSARANALVCTKEELEFISKNLTTQAFFSEQANLKNFQEMDPSSIIHLATHACLDDEDDAFNKLIFYDDYLSIQDLESMHLSADLAVLSACNTGMGTMKAGEGVIHLGKAFRAAGVSSLVTSLWSINDCATSNIVGKFYAGLKNKHISSALRNAKLDYLTEANKLMAHPHFWAGLTFSGNTNALRKTNAFNNYLPYLAACLAIILGFFFYRQQN